MFRKRDSPYLVHRGGLPQGVQPFREEPVFHHGQVLVQSAHVRVKLCPVNRVDIFLPQNDGFVHWGRFFEGAVGVQAAGGENPDDGRAQGLVGNRVLPVLLELWTEES